MKAWGTSAFCNDDASDWRAVLTACPDFSVIHLALDAATVENRVSWRAAARAIAAAAVVACLNGKPVIVPTSVHYWVCGQPVPDAVLNEKAHRAISSVLRDSELRDHWAQTDQHPEWLALVRDIESRIPPTPFTDDNVKMEID